MCVHARLVPALLLHVSLLLTVLSGAGLATAARLKWDPSTYVVLRELFPAEYRVAAGALCASSLALVVLAHVAALALALPARAWRVRRALLLVVAALHALLLVLQAAWLGWTGARVAAWVRGAQAQQVAEVVAVREQLAPLLQALARWHPLPERVRELLAEAERDAPHNLHVAGAALTLAALLQPAVALLALAAAAGRRPRPAARCCPELSSYASSTDNEKAPLRTAYRKGKLVIV